MSDELIIYQKFLYKTSEGNPIKLAVLIRRDLFNNNSLAMQLFDDKINVDTVVEKAEQIVNQIESKKPKHENKI
jgi:delta 1-pyrroline-5-carboxylate dehydrogenase